VSVRDLDRLRLKLKKEMLLLTSHFRSKVDVFVYAFLARRMSASFLAACRMGSESGEDF